MRESKDSLSREFEKGVCNMTNIEIDPCKGSDLFFHHFPRECRGRRAEGGQRQRIDDGVSCLRKNVWACRSSGRMLNINIQVLDNRGVLDY